MPLDPNIILQAQTPQPPSLFQTAGSLMGLQDQSAQIAQRRAQAADQQAQAAQRARDLQDQATVQDAMRDPEKARRIVSGDLSDLNGLVQPTTLDSVQKARDTHQTTLLSNNKTTLEESASDLAKLEKGLLGLKEFVSNDANEGKLPEASAQFIANMQAQGAFRHFTGGPVPQALTNPDDIDLYLAKIGAQYQALTDALAVKEKREEIAGKQAIRENTEAELGGKQAESGIKQYELNALTNPEQAGGGLEDIVDPAKYPERYAAYKAQLGKAVTLEQRAAVLHQAQEEMGGIAKETNPTIMAAKAKQAGMNASATIGPEVQKAVQTEIQKAKLAPGAVSGIMNPTLQLKVIGDFTKADDEYQSKVGDAQRLLNFVQAARSGNQTAASMIPVAEVRAIVNRLNTQELNAAGGGSIARRLSNLADKALEGKPSEATLKDAEDFARLSLDAAKKTKNGKLSTLNTLGANFPLEQGASTTPMTGAATHRYNPATGKIEVIQ